MSNFAATFSVLLSIISIANGFLVNGWVEEWEYENATDLDPESRPGFRVRVTQKGFDTAARLGLDVMMAFLDQLVVPDVQQAIGNADVTISNVRINRLARPRAEIKNIPEQGIFARIYKVQPKVTADYKAIVSWGFLGATEAAGEVVVRGKSLRFSIELTVGRSEFEDGPPMKIEAICAFEGELNIVFAGDMQDILNVGSSVFGSNIMSLIASSICDEVNTKIAENMITDLSSVPTNETADVEFDFNFGMVQFPEFNEDFVELYQRGTVYYRDNRIEPPFQPAPIPAYVNHTDKMIYIYVSDYVMNTALYAGYLSNYMAYNVTPDLLPPEVRNSLRTTCEHPDVCLGSVFESLSTLYSNEIAGVNIYATKNPEIHVFGGATAKISAQGEAIFFVDDEYSNTRTSLFKIQYDISGAVTVGVNGSTIKFYLSEIFPSVDIVESYIGDIGTGGEAFRNVIGVAADKLVIPKLSELGERGFELPKTDEVEFVHPEIILLDVDGTFVVATDFDISLPEEMLEKGTHTFRRTKGCKTNCKTTPGPFDETTEENDFEDDESEGLSGVDGGVHSARHDRRGKIARERTRRSRERRHLVDASQ